MLLVAILVPVDCHVSEGSSHSHVARLLGLQEVTAASNCERAEILLEPPQTHDISLRVANTLCDNAAYLYMYNYMQNTHH